MNENDTSKVSDDDILQHKKDILRAKDIIPSGDSKAQANQKTADIPKFDLAEQIMAQHRKVTAIRRKAPDQKAEPEKPKQPTVLARYAEQIKSVTSEQDRVIAEIVANDIKKLCEGKMVFDNF